MLPWIEARSVRFEGKAVASVARKRVVGKVDFIVALCGVGAVWYAVGVMI